MITSESGFHQMQDRLAEVVRDRFDWDYAAAGVYLHVGRDVVHDAIHRNAVPSRECLSYLGTVLGLSESCISAVDRGRCDGHILVPLVMGLK